jgi:hypothetical protein
MGGCQGSAPRSLARVHASLVVKSRSRWPRPVEARCKKIGWNQLLYSEGSKVHNAVPGDDEKASPRLPNPHPNRCGGRGPILYMYDASLSPHWGI